MKKACLLFIVLIIYNIATAQQKRPLFILNDKPTDVFVLSFVPAEDVESIEVLKERAALDKYGKEGAKDGVVAITLKKAAQPVSYPQLLESFHIPVQDTVLPAFVDGYAVRYKNNFYSNKKSIQKIAKEIIGERKIIHIYPTNPVQLPDENHPREEMCLINGKPVAENSIDFIDPQAVKSVAYLYGDEAQEIYGGIRKGGIVIYLNENVQLQPLSFFYNAFHIPVERQDWPLFYAGTDTQIGKDAFVAMPSMIKSLRVNNNEIRLEIESTPTLPSVETLAKKVKEVSVKRGSRASIMICTISRRSLLQQYVKK